MMPNSWFLIPGFGAQGGSAKDIAPAFDENGRGALINSSRQIIFAYQQKDAKGTSNWQQFVEQATLTSIAQINAVATA